MDAPVLLPSPPAPAPEALQGEKGTKDEKVEVVFHGPLPPLQTAPELDVLAPASKLFTINERTMSLSLHPSLPHMSQVFSVYNSKAEHILTAAEVRRSPFFRMPRWKSQIFICSAQGDPIALLSQRNDGVFAATKADPSFEACYRADRMMRIRSHEDTSNLDGVTSHVHLQLLSTGKFIGHLFQGNSSTAILDANFNSIFAFRERDSLVEAMTAAERKHLEGEEPEEEDEGDISANRGKNMPNRPQSLGSGGQALEWVSKRRHQTNYDLVEEAQQVGAVDSNASLRKLMQGADSNDCFTCTFPREYTQVDKALILGFVLFKQRTESWGEYFLHMMMFTFLMLVAGLTVVGIVLATFYRFDSNFP